MPTKIRKRIRPSGELSPDWMLPRHQAPWPVEKLEATPFVYDPARRVLISSFPCATRRLSFAEQECLEQVQQIIARIGRSGERPFWIWPNGRTEPIRDAVPGWLEHWARDRSAYQLRGG